MKKLITIIIALFISILPSQSQSIELTDFNGTTGCLGMVFSLTPIAPINGKMPTIIQRQE